MATTAQITGRTAAFQASPGYRRYVLGLLLAVGIFNFVDRQILSILLQAIKTEFGFSDTQLGLLTGPAFVVFHVIAGIPIAWAADRYNRRNIIAICLAAWSAMTALCGMATGFWSLFLARVGVGVGEAGGGPSAQSLVGDYFEPARRGTALAVLGTGFPLGGLAGFLIGGWVTQFYGWRTAFMVVGLPGVLLALVVWLTLREPPRGHSEKITDSTAPDFWSCMKYFARRASFIHLALAGALFSMAAWGGTAWMPAYFIRVHGMTPAQVGTWLALIIGTAGVVGVLSGGSIADRVAAARKDDRWYVWVPAISLFAALPFAFFVYLWPEPVPALLCLFFPMVLANMFVGPTGAMIIGVAGVRRRAMASALYVVLLNLLGMGLGPLAVGIISDIFTADYGVNALRYSLLTLAIVANLWAALHFLLAGRSLREDLEAARTS